jgi:EAL domain-containing protein (putative c-di-GMP-specific phosphodiesterase class I)
MDLLWSAFASEKASIIYRSTVEMLKELGMRIVSEGAETQEHVSMLHELGVDYIQGYYYGEPLDKTGYLTLLAEEKRRLADRGEALGAH